ncbi:MULTISPECIES: GNAT family N-acetyltransferase [unclassified Pseudactinotalea]|uniref:GNAT family N-acetyltransferase n=1 Tax=unclassified Pseudactinotalea TaxID=2649176 RepID=UPI003C7EB24B
MRIERVHGLSGLARVHGLRWTVFVEEQGVLPAEELDGRDESDSSVHLIAVDPDFRDVGTARMLTDAEQPGVVHATRVAVLTEARGQGVGRALMAELERIAYTEFAVDGQVRVELSAQETALPFYESLGYEIGAERYLDARMWHRDAVKVLTSAPDAAEPR